MQHIMSNTVIDIEFDKLYNYRHILYRRLAEYSHVFAKG